MRVDWAISAPSWFGSGSLNLGGATFSFAGVFSGFRALPPSLVALLGFSCLLFAMTSLCGLSSSSSCKTPLIKEAPLLVMTLTYGKVFAPFIVKPSASGAWILSVGCLMMDPHLPLMLLAVKWGESVGWKCILVTLHVFLRTLESHFDAMQCSICGVVSAEHPCVMHSRLGQLAPSSQGNPWLISTCVPGFSADGMTKMVWAPWNYPFLYHDFVCWLWSEGLSGC